MIEISRVEEPELCNKNHSWQSPIYITDRIIDYQVEHLDNMVVADVRKIIETHIDKEALLDALNGSREQYEKGYAEGREDAYQESIKQLKELKDLKNAIAEVRHKVRNELDSLQDLTCGYRELYDGKSQAYTYVLWLIDKHIKEVWDGKNTD